jgi:NAD(P)-dependent dehydrogenase (short-subunit alcohol dehydrogenase family)
MSLLAGRHALVTGGGSGIGAAIARAFAAEGAAVSLVGRGAEKLEATASTIAADVAGARLFAASGDVTNAAEVETAFAAARAAFGPVSILINNAGAAESAPFAKTDEALWRRMMGVNLDALLHCCRTALPDLLAVRSGRIVTVASTAGLKGYAYTSAYVAAKHGAIGLTRALAVELAATGVTVNAVCPGFTETDILTHSVATVARVSRTSAQEARAQLARFNPQGRFIRPEEVADAVLWLCSPAAAAMTGQAISVSAGEVM